MYVTVRSRFLALAAAWCKRQNLASTLEETVCFTVGAIRTTDTIVIVFALLE